MYTLATIRHLCSIFGVAEAGADEADVLWVSISDPDDIKVLWDARKIANGRPVIMGGFEAWFGVPYLAWADAVVVGEGVEFIRTWGEQGMDAALDLPCVLTMDRYKRGIEVLPSYDVGYLDMPIVKVGGKVRYYFLAGRSAWRTALHRCTPEEALELPPEPKDTNVEESFRNFRAGLDGRGLGFLLDGSRKLNEAAIKTRIK